MTGLAVLAGIGFTVSLLIGELAYGAGTARDDHVKIAILVGSLTAAVLASILLRIRIRTYRRICESEDIDTDRDASPTSTRQSCRTGTIMTSPTATSTKSTMAIALMPLASRLGKRVLGLIGHDERWTKKWSVSFLVEHSC